MELPKLIENADTTKVSVHLNNALDKLSSGDYPGVLLDCQKALEETRSLAKAKGYTKEAENGQQNGNIDFSKFTDTERIKDGLDKTWRGIWSFLQPGGRHIGSDRGREEAWFAILTTYGMVNLIIRSTLPS